MFSNWCNLAVKRVFGSLWLCWNPGYSETLMDMKAIAMGYLVWWLGSLGVQAQDVKRDSVQISGVVYDVDRANVLPEPILQLNRNLIAPETGGKFNLWVHRGDLLRFSHAGFKDASVFISDSIWQVHNLLGVFFSRDTVRLAEIIVAPRYSRLAVNARYMPVISSAEQVYATQNIQKSTVVALTTAPSKMDAQMNQKMVMAEHTVPIAYKGMVEPGRMVGVGNEQLTTVWKQARKGSGGGSSGIVEPLTPQEVNYLISLYRQSLNKTKP